MKIKMLVTCKAYTAVHKIESFEKGKKYDVNKFLYGSFIKTKRAISLEFLESGLVENTGTFDEENMTEKEEPEEETEEEEETEGQEEEEGENEPEEEESKDQEETSETIDIKNMTRKRLKKYAKKLGIPFKGNPSVKTLINIINEAKHD